MFSRRSFAVLGPLYKGTVWTRAQSTGPKLDIGGIYPPIATPFSENEDVDYDKLGENLKKYAKIPFKGK